MKKIILCILTSFFFQNAFASEDSNRPENERGNPTYQGMHDLTCHWCRISKNRPKKTKKLYKDCPSCSKTFCARCIEENPEIEPQKDGCLHCKIECCCNSECEINHRCCFTSRRTEKRHFDHKPKWTKTKRQKNSEGNCEANDTIDLCSEDKSEDVEVEDSTIVDILNSLLEHRHQIEVIEAIILEEEPYLAEVAHTIIQNTSAPESFGEPLPPFAELISGINIPIETQTTFTPIENSAALHPPQEFALEDPSLNIELPTLPFFNVFGSYSSGY